MAGMDLPANMTEEDVLQIVRELCGDGDEMSDEELRNAYRSGMFQELCPDIEHYAKQRHGGGVVVKEEKLSPVKAEPRVNPGISQSASYQQQSTSRDTKTEPQSNHVDLAANQVKVEVDSDTKSVASRHSHKHHKKKKKKHSKDKKKDRDKEERREKHKSKFEHKSRVIMLSDTSDSEVERQKREEKKKEKRKKILSSSSDNESIPDRKIKAEQTTTKVVDMVKKEHCEDKVTEDGEKPKVHPFYQERSGNQPSSSTKEPDNAKVPEKKREPKPFTRYNSGVSKTSLKRWRPILDRDHLKYQRRFRLKPVSVVCVDLLDMPMMFHDPRKSKTLNSVPLVSGTQLSDMKRDIIKRLERDKANWYKSKLKRRAIKFLKFGKHRNLDSSDEDNRMNKRARIMDRLVSSDTNSDSSSVMIPSKKIKKEHDSHRDRGSGKSKQQKEEELRRKKIEEISRKAHKLSSKGTRILPWENKETYFKSAKKKEDPAKEKERALAEKKKRILEKQKEREEKLKNAPSISFQRILKQIESANKEQASKPKVELKIPKKNQNPDRFVPISEYKPDGKVGVGDVYKEVAKLLSRNVLVECPVLAEAIDDLGEYTVKKIAWWILKNEKDPAPEGAYHPECHDDDDLESIRSDDFEWPDDVSSITGCVSDPEGVAADIPADPKKIADPDWADDYCGEAALYGGKFRRETAETRDKQFPIDSWEPFKTFLRVKPGTNYSKPNFEVKCFLCNEVIRGQRQFGAHIRSDSHKNNFRNYSLDMASYEEHVATPTPQKRFTAQLVEYSTNPSASNSTVEKPDASSQPKIQVAKIERVRSDSPGPIVAGDAAPNIIVHQMPIPDDISLPSYEDYDISSDESLMNVKVAIRTAAKWDDDLERRWRTWRDEEAKIAEEYNGERDFFINAPEKHPCYKDEWPKFWDKRYAELEAEGQDAENYDYLKEWQSVWFKRMQEIMKERVELRVAELKRSLQIDKHTLRARFGIPPGTTSSQKKKKKRKLGQESSSCGKSLSKTDTNDDPSFKQPPRQNPQPQPSQNLQSQPSQNHIHSKPACLPTPPITDEDRNRIGNSNGNNNTNNVPHMEQKFELPSNHHDRRIDENHKDVYQNKTKDHKDKHDDDRKRHRDKSKSHRDKHDEHRKRHKDKHRSHRDKKYNDDRKEKHHRDHHHDRNDKYNNRGDRDDRKREHDHTTFPPHPENSNSNGAFGTKQTESVSSVSSGELPPGEGDDAVLMLNSHSKSGPPPTQSAPFSKFNNHNLYKKSYDPRYHFDYN